ncbi:MAG: alkaline phosphatase family protein [Candidatus Riflebacteria bacterium]|nr:alkaline phosphatase family protein [Candidatus Riflebacteria bacterium]
MKTLLVSLALGAAFSSVARAAPPKVARVVLIVIDQCRADYPNRFPMPRVNELISAGTSFSEATVGHLPAVTVVSHAVIATGLFPGHLPWGDELYPDTTGLLGQPGKLYLSARLEFDEFEKLYRSLGKVPESLPALLRKTLGGPVYAIGSKGYSASCLGAAGADSTITLGDPIEDGRWAGFRGPAGSKLPPGLVGPVGGPLFLDTHGTHGTAHLEYPQKGELYIDLPGTGRDGGDLWMANVALKVMRLDPGWRGLLITMPGVDRVGHLLGEFSGRVDLGQGPGIHLEAAVATADRAVGRIVDRLRTDGLLEETLLVVTSDHGATAGSFLGDAGPERAYDNWYFGAAANGAHRRPSRAVAPLASLSNVRFIAADTMVRAWLADRSIAALVQAGRVAFGLPGVREVHGLVNGRYVRLFSRSSGDPESDRPWLRPRVLLNTLAAPHAPHVVALLGPGVTYGTRGDHGGDQDDVQRIPLVFTGPGVARGRVVSGQARLVDVVPTIRSLLGLSPGGGYDGEPLVGE